MDGEIMQRTLQGADAPAQESFEELIAGRCREDFTRKVQQIIDRRFAEHRAKEENWSKWIPAMEKLCEDRGLDREDAEGLTKLLNSLAGEKDRREGLREWAACQALRGWMEEAAALGERYPNFDLQAAMEGEGFMELLCKGLGVQQAWELCNRTAAGKAAGGWAIDAERGGDTAQHEGSEPGGSGGTGTSGNERGEDRDVKEGMEVRGGSMREWGDILSQPLADSSLCGGEAVDGARLAAFQSPRHPFRPHL